MLIPGHRREQQKKTVCSVPNQLIVNGIAIKQLIVALIIMDMNLGADTAGLYAKTTMMEAAKCERDSSKDSGESDCE